MTKTLSKFLFILSFIFTFGNPFITKAEEIQKFSMYTFPKHLPKGTFFNAKDDVVSVQDYQGKVVVLNFFKVTCKKCVKELPSLNELAKASSSTTDKKPQKGSSGGCSLFMHTEFITTSIILISIASVVLLKKRSKN